jgi:hypothetical protein
MSNEDDAKKIVAIQQVAVTDYCVNGTPTFFMNGKKLASGEIAYFEVDEKLRAELKSKGIVVPGTPAAAPTDGTATPPAGAASPGTSPSGTPPATPAAPTPDKPASSGTPH